MIRLKYLIKSYKKSNIQAGEGQSEGPVPFYTSSEGLKLYYNYAQYPFDSISMGTGGFASINYSSVPFSTSTDCFNFSGSKKAYTKFLYYWIYSRIDYVDDLYFWGMGLKHLQKPYFLNERLALPTIDKQKQIADFLDNKIAKVDALIKSLKNEIIDLESYKVSLFSKIILKGRKFNTILNNNTEGFTIGRVKYYYDIVLGKMVQPNKLGYNDTLENYLCAQNIKPNGLDVSYVKQMWFNKNEKSKYILHPGDLLIVEGGSIGETAFYNGESAPCYIQNALHKVTPSSYLNNSYLYYWLKILKSIGYFEKVCNKATISHFTKDKLENMPILILTKEECDAYVTKFNTIDKQIRNFIDLKSNKIIELERYKKSLIYEYVSGKKEVPYEFN